MTLPRAPPDPLNNSYQVPLNDIFSRPMTPAPPPLVHINGSPGVGKQAVAESLTLLLGQDKSLLVHGQSDQQAGYYRHRHPAYPKSPVGTRTPETKQRQLRTTLSHPRNTTRLAILPRYAPNIPSGRAAIRSYRAAAEHAGRVFVSVALVCEDEEEREIRRGSLQRWCRFKTRGGYMDLYEEDEEDEEGREIKGEEGREVKGEEGLAVGGGEGTVTIDVSRVRPLEAAMRIAEVVWTAVEERDAELCASAATTPRGGEAEWRWK